MTSGLDLSTQEARDEAATAALANKRKLFEVVALLAEGSRSERQFAANVVRLVGEQKPEKLVEHVEAIADALNRPEAQTRWECMVALRAMLPYGIELSRESVEAIEDSLFDDGKGLVREAAFALSCAYGATTPEASQMVWPYIDEAIQCYHGNGEFSDMLTELVGFAEGDIAAEVKEALANRMQFDAQNAKGTLRMRAEQIVDICK